MIETATISQPRAAAALPPRGRIIRPIGAIGRHLTSFTVFCGGVVILVVTALRATFRPRGEPAPFGRTTIRHLDRVLLLSFPLVAIVFIGMGSFLAMQAYFGATFLDGIGPLVGVGLVRNLAPLMSGFILAGVLAPRYMSEIRWRSRMRLDDDPEWHPDRDASPLEHDRVASHHSTEPARLIATRIAAAILAGPLLGLWASAVGIFVGWGVGRTMLGVTTPGFFDMFVEMLWVRDVVGLVIKGMLFGAAAGIYPCFEASRITGESHTDLSTATARAACLAGLTILFINSAWFLLFYHAGPAFGPTVLAPPQL